MTKKGWRSVLMREDVVKRAEQYVFEINYKRGEKYFRSITHFLNHAIVRYIEEFKDSDLKK